MSKKDIALENLLALFPSKQREDARFRNAIEIELERVEEWWDGEVTAAIEYLDGNGNNLGKSELHRKLKEAFERTQEDVDWEQDEHLEALKRAQEELGKRPKGGGQTRRTSGM